MDIRENWHLIGLLVLVFGAGFAVAAIGMPGGDDAGATMGTPTVASDGGATAPEDTPAATSAPEDPTSIPGEELTTPNTQRYELNTTYVELAIHKRINNERQARSIPLLDYNATLAEAAEYHSEDMATYLYVAHESPNNETLQDRYERFGFDCSVPKHDGTGQYATGAENLDKTYYKRQVTRQDGSIEYYDTLDKLATGIVKDWMNTPAQREELLRDYWQRQGIGVTAYENADGEITIVVTQNFC